MTWQEELRKLDEELAAGNITADDYRVRRDQVLSSAVAPGEQGQPPAPGQQAPQAPQQPPQGQQPQQPQQGQPESTQIIAPVSNQPGQQGPPQSPPQGQPEAEPTQAVSGWQGGEPERTQYVPGAQQGQQVPQGQYGQPPVAPGGQQQFDAFNPQQQYGGQQPYGAQQFVQPYGQQQYNDQAQTPWGTAEDDEAPPWGGDFPPLSPGSTSDWGVKQGPEESGGGSSKKGKTILTIVGVVALLAVAGFAVWFFALSGDNGGGQNTAGGDKQNEQGGEQPKPQPKSLDEALPAPPGTPDPSNGTMDISEGVQSGQLTAQEVQALKSAGVEKIVFKGSKDGEFTYESIVFEAKDEQSAQQLAKELYEAAIDTGMQDGAQGALPASAKVTQRIQQPKVGMYKVSMASGKRIARVAVTQEPIGKDDQKLIPKFQQYAVSVSKNVAP